MLIIPISFCSIQDSQKFTLLKVDGLKFDGTQLFIATLNIFDGVNSKTNCQLTVPAIQYVIFINSNDHYMKITMYIHTHTQHTPPHICMHVCTHMHTHAHMHTLTDTHTQTQTQHTHTRTHTHLNSLQRCTNFIGTSLHQLHVTAVSRNHPILIKISQ